MKYKIFDDVMLVRMETGDDLTESLRDACQREGFKFGIISGVGSTKYASIAHWDTEKKEYASVEFNELMEISAIAGNVTLKDGEVWIHTHLTLGGPRCITYSGHCQRAIIQNTAEIFIQKVKGIVNRKLMLNCFNFMDI